MMTDSVIWWWFLLCVVGALNILAWVISAVTLHQRRIALPPQVHAACRLQLLLSAGYVFGCAFRSALPVYDVPRLCLLNSWLSSVIVGRSVATFAELCFAGQWALMLREAARPTGSLMGMSVSRAILPLIGLAEVCSWYSVLTTSNLGHVAEESLWGTSAALLVVGLLAILPRSPPAQRSVLTAWCAAGVAYVAFMFLIDVPMYWSRWMANEASGRRYLSIAQGVLDASEHRLVSYRWEDWKSEVIWMSLYFSVGVWLSISLIHVGCRKASLQPRRRSTPALPESGQPV
jgi:hypothetical protein